jgi:O-antigen ligase
MFGIFGFAFKRSSLFGLLTVVLLFITNYYIVEIVQTLAQALGLQEFLRLNEIEKGSGRIIAWVFAWKEINENTFFLGNGFDYTNYFFGINHDKLSLLGHQGNAHNSYLTFWLETGLIGLLFFMYGFVKSFLNMSYKTRYAIPAMFAISFTMFFESWFTAGMNPYLIQVLMILVLVDLPRVAEAEKEKEMRESQVEEEQLNRLSHFSFLRKEN